MGATELMYGFQLGLVVPLGCTAIALGNRRTTIGIGIKRLESVGTKARVGMHTTSNR